MWFKEIVFSFARYVLAGILAVMYEYLTEQGIDAAMAENFTEAVSTAIGTGILIVWSMRKNKKNAEIKKDVAAVPELAAKHKLNKGKHYENTNP